MNRRDASRALASIPLAMAVGLITPQHAVAADAQGYPRLQAAITAIQDALDFMSNAPDTFGGHKAAAMTACRTAIRQLNAAMNWNAAHQGK
ncbi:MAG TPA: hypothetical protein VMF70_12265 [Gemmatimonadales bacterium]|nr:hypothetical protein [Gemmatimonadales bacterium]